MKVAQPGPSATTVGTCGDPRKSVGGLVCRGPSDPPTPPDLSRSVRMCVSILSRMLSIIVIDIGLLICNMVVGSTHCCVRL